MLLREHPADGGGLHGAEQEPGEGRGPQRVQVGAAHRRQSGNGQSLGHLSKQLHALRVELEESRGGNAGDDDEECHRAVTQPEFAREQDRQRSQPYEKRDGVGLGQVREEIGTAIPEIAAVRAGKPEQLRELRAREVQRETRLEADKHRFREGSDGAAGAHQPCRDRDDGHHERQGCGERRVPGGIARAQFRGRGAGEQRQRGCHRDHRVPRAAEDPEQETRKKTGVEPGLRRQSGERRVADAGGQQVGRKRQPRDEIGPEPLASIGPQPLRRGER